MLCIQLIICHFFVLCFDINQMVYGDNIRIEMQDPGKLITTFTPRQIILFVKQGDSSTSYN